MAKSLNLVGERFGDLTVKESAGTDKWRNKLWLCECTCGNTVIVATRRLINGWKIHCGLCLITLHVIVAFTFWTINHCIH